MKLNDGVPEEFPPDMPEEIKKEIIEYGKSLYELEGYTEIAQQMFIDKKKLSQFFVDIMAGTVKDPKFANPQHLFDFAFFTGFAKCLQEVADGHINISTVKIDKGAKHENNQESDNPLTRRNRSAQDEQSNEVAGE